MKTIAILFCALFLTSAAFAQTTITGRVAEVIDGKTVVIKTANFTKVTVKLQFVDVPLEPKNDFTAVVKGHLQQLLEGKTLQFQTRRMADFSMLIGVLTADGVDVSQQMLRDGAAWYAIPEMDDQEAAEREAYLKVEAAAKSEKRGIWGIKDLKPVWENAAAKTERPEPADKKQPVKTVSSSSQAVNSASSSAN